MDFAAFDARGAAEKPRPMPLRHQVTGETIMDGDKPCCVLVRGASSRAVQEAIRAENRAQMGKEKPKSLSPEDYHDDTKRAAKRLVVGFENVARGDRPATLDDLDWFLDLTMANLSYVPNGKTWTRPSFAQQIITFATDDAHFLGNGSPA